MEHGHADNERALIPWQEKCQEEDNVATVCENHCHHIVLDTW
jgi:hypothetical protein